MRESTLEAGLTLTGDGRDGDMIGESISVSVLLQGEVSSKVNVTNVEVRVVETEGSSGAYSSVVVW